MKKIRLLLICVLIGSALYGCKTGETGTGVLSPTPGITHAADTPTPTVTAEPTPTEVPVKEIDISKFERYEDYGSLFLAFESEEGIAYEKVYPFGEYLLLCGTKRIPEMTGSASDSSILSWNLAGAPDGDYEEEDVYLQAVFTLYDPYENKVVKTLVEEEESYNFYTHTDSSVISFYDGCRKCRIYDKDLCLQYSFDIPEASELMLPIFYFGKNTFPFYTQDTNTMEILRYELENDALTCTRFTTPYKKSELLDVCADGKSLILNGLDDRFAYQTFIWSPDEDRILFQYERAPEYGYLRNRMEDNTVLLDVDSASGTWLWQSPELGSRFLCLDGSIPNLTNNNKLLLVNYNSEETENGSGNYVVLHLHDFDGTMIAGIRYDLEEDIVGQEENFWMLNPELGAVITCNDTDYLFMTLTDYYSKSKVFLWDTSKANDDEPASEYVSASDYEEFKIKTGRIRGQHLAEFEDLYEKADRIGERFGVNIYIADEVPDTFDIYALEKCLDHELVEAMLDKLEECMSCYPENFFSQNRYKNISEMNFYLASTLSGMGGNSLTTAGAFVNHQNTVTSMVIDCSELYSLDYIFHHETFHMIDERLQFVASFLNSTYSDNEFAEFNPKGFDYLYSYSDYEDFEYSGDYYTKGYNKYFLDSYSVSYPSEDKAIIFGRAVQYTKYPEWSDWSIIKDEPVIYEKYRYLCKSIRELYDTTDWPEVTIWEGGLSADIVSGNQ